jgi:hypothetical protein
MKGPGKGKTNNPAGRPAGVPNKLTRELREIINDFLNENIESVKRDYKTLEPKDRVKIYIELLNYGLPKFQSITGTGYGNDSGAKHTLSLFPTREELEAHKRKMLMEAKAGS